MMEKYTAHDFYADNYGCPFSLSLKSLFYFNFMYVSFGCVYMVGNF